MALCLVAGARGTGGGWRDPPFDAARGPSPFAAAVTAAVTAAATGGPTVVLAPAGVDAGAPGGGQDSAYTSSLTITFDAPSGGWSLVEGGRVGPSPP